MAYKTVLKNILFIFCFSKLSLYAQQIDSNVNRIGLYAGYDIQLNSADKILKARPQRRLNFGLSFTPKNKTFIGFGGVGIKFSKYHLISPQFTNEFKSEVKSNITDYSHLHGHDSLVETMYNISKGTDGYKIKGSYHQFIQVGFILKRKISPSIMFYYGGESILINAPFNLSTNENGDINYISLNSNFMELAFGLSFILDKGKAPIAVNLRIGYVERKYGDINISGVDLSEYTSGTIANDFANTRNLNISISILGWTNWNN